MKERTKNNWKKILNIPFIRKNFRKLSFEDQIIFISQLLTLIGCFLPWVSITPEVYGRPYYYNAFNGPTRVIGFFIFLFASISIVFFLEKIWQKKIIKISLDTKTILHSANIQSLVLLVCACSVFLQIENTKLISTTSFGWLLCFFTQITTIVAHFLSAQNSQKKAVQDFFINKKNE